MEQRAKNPKASFLQQHLLKENKKIDSTGGGEGRRGRVCAETQESLLKRY